MTFPPDYGLSRVQALMARITDSLIPSGGEPLERVEQASDYDCGLACLAMVLRLPDPRAVVPLVGREPEADVSHLTSDLGSLSRAGLTSEEISLVLFQASLPYLTWTNEQVFRDANIAWRWDLRDVLHVLREDDVREYLERGGTAILSVGSKNFRDGSHWVVANRGRLLDPARAGYHRYETLEECLPTAEAILVRV